MSKTQSERRKRSGWGYRIIVGILCLIIVFCIYKIGSIVYEYYAGTKTYGQIQDMAGADVGRIDFGALAKENEDIRAWLFSKDTVINYPVVQGKDNEFYLYRMFNREWNGKGSLFIDYRCKEPFVDFNTIIYGHRMRDGSMFHSLTKYREQDYYEKHKTMELTTPDKKYRVKIFSVMTIPADSEFYRFDFCSDEEKADYVAQIKAKSETPMEDVQISSEDRIVMLSTCTYEFDDARLVVYGKLEEVK